MPTRLESVRASKRAHSSIVTEPYTHACMRARASLAAVSFVTRGTGAARASLRHSSGNLSLVQHG